MESAPPQVMPQVGFMGCLAYNGAHYIGWQRQSAKAETKRPSVQSKLEEAVASMLGYSVPVVSVRFSILHTASNALLSRSVAQMRERMLL